MVVTSTGGEDTPSVWARLTVTVVLLTQASALGAYAWLRLTTTAHESYPAMLPAMAAFALVGAAIMLRRPGNRVGWVFAGIGCLGPIAGLALEFTGAHVAGEVNGPAYVATLAAWLVSWTWWPAIALLLVGVPLVFPDGRLLSRRWWAVGAPVILSTAVLVLFSAFSEVLVDELFGTVPNPVGIPGLPPLTELPAAFGAATVVLSYGAAGAAVAMIARFHRSRGVERQQLKWFTAATVLMVVAFATTEHLPFTVLVREAIGGLAFAAVPVAAGVAVFRYRLYDIDRVISRTLTYAVLIGALAGGYAVLVVSLQALLAPVTSGSDLAVAASTLAVAAAFGPVRRRIRSTVDRRFDRSHYDAAATVGQFSQRLRDELHLDALIRELQLVAGDAVHPRHASVWLTGPGAAR
jgi:hypothetical protein